MSRRKAFNTFLTTSESQPSALAVAAAPAIAPPDPAHATLHVPSGEDDANTTSGQSSDVTPPEVDDVTTCFICAESITLWSVGVCGHRTCHVCAIRLRVFYKKFECTYCKTICPSVLFSHSPTTPFPASPRVPESSARAIERAQADADKPENKGKVWWKGLTLPGALDLKAFPYTDEKMGVVFEDEDMMESTLLLLRFNCPYPDCPHMAANWSHLSKHTLAEHGLVLCRLCTTQLSRFAHEQVLYPPNLIGLHDPSRVPRGQRPPRPKGADIELVKGWDAPHPMCEFCHEAFFGTDELFKHMRDKHEHCFVCRDLGERDVYFENYLKLEEHFKFDHYPCLQPSCVERKFVVFGSELDLRAHLMSEHSEDMSARDRAQARTLNVDFSARPDRAESSRGQRASGPRGFTLGGASSRDGPSQQQIAAPPMAAAQADQRRRQVQVDRQEESRRRRAFVGTLSENAAAGGAANGSRRDGPTSASSGAATPREDVNDATAARHNELLNRVSALVDHSALKLASFRSAVRSFKVGEAGARDMVDQIFHVLDQDGESTASITRELATLFGADGEKDREAAVLEALNGWRAQREESFPALMPAAPTGVGSSYAGISSGRILNAKRVASGAGRGGRTVWDRVEAAAASRPASRPSAKQTRYVPGSGLAAESAFPSLGSGPGAGPGSAVASGSRSTPWSASSSGRAPTALAAQARIVPFPASAPASAPTSRPASRTGPSRPPRVDNAAFPSLPVSTKTSAAERAALFKPTPRDESIRRIMGQAPPPQTNGWAASGSVADVDEATAGVEGLDVGQKKKKGKGKQLLFTVSARPS
ncbi:hypothetical protein Q5752_003008 [Cryptotrichosporon argae]